MISLQNAESGGSYKVTWMLGRYAGYLQKEWGLRVDDVLSVLTNNGSTLIVRYNGHKVAMSSDVAMSVKTEPV